MKKHYSSKHCCSKRRGWHAGTVIGVQQFWNPAEHMLPGLCVRPRTASWKWFSMDIGAVLWAWFNLLSHPSFPNRKTKITTEYSQPTLCPKNVGDPKLYFKLVLSLFLLFKLAVLPKETISSQLCEFSINLIRVHYFRQNAQLSITTT